MGEQYIIVSSITYAYKGKSVLERKGIRAGVQKAPSNLSECGCNYAIKVRGDLLNRALQILDGARIKVISSGGADDGVY